MIGGFNVRNLIGDRDTLGKVLLALPAFLAGYLVARPRVRGGAIERPSTRAVVLAGIGTGILTGGVTAVGVALAKVPGPENGRNMFVAVTPGLLNIMTFGHSLPTSPGMLKLAGHAPRGG